MHPTLSDLEAKAHLIWAGQKNTKASLRRFRVCVVLLGPATPLASIRTKQLDRLKEALWQLPGVRSPQTINRYLAALSRALRWAAARDMIHSLPYIPRERGESFRLVYFTEEEEKAILAFFMARGELHRAVLLRVLSVTGLRAGELLAVREKDVDMGSVHVITSKNGKGRFVPLDPPLDTAFRDAIRAGLPTYYSLLHSLKQARKQLGFTDPKGLHVFRHTCATRLTKLGVPTAVVQAFLGHRSINTTMKYAHVDNASLRAAARLLDASFALTYTVLPGKFSNHSSLEASSRLH